MSESGKAEFCSQWLDKMCLQGFVDKHPNALPHSLAFVYLFFSSRELAAYIFIILIASLSVPLMYFLAVLLFNNREIGYFSALFMSLAPVHILWSGSVSTEIYYVFLSLMVFIITLLYVQNKCTSLLVASATLLSYTIQTRPESLFFSLIIILSLILFSKQKNSLEIFDNLLLYALIFLLFSTLHITHLNYTSKVDSWGAKGEKLSMDYLKRNLSPNIRFMIDPSRSFVILIPLMLLSLINFRSNFSEKFILLVWMLAFFVIFLLFYAGSVEAGGTSSRFVVMWYPPLILLAAHAIAKINKFFSKYIDIKTLYVYWCVLIVLSFYPTLDFIRTVDPQADVGRIMRDMGIEMSQKLPDNCVVITGTPSIFIVQGQNSMDFHNALNKENLKSIYNKHKCVYFFEDYWCKYVKKSQCDAILTNNEHELVDTILVEKKWPLSFYELHP
ncbi:MAG: glycosyltransferase family 39 protein [Candidatus Altiarchaeota archaeon]|nr:glycosyltransferase family 39 protein [Candidatus Altiarchaeota archaeon]